MKKPNFFILGAPKCGTTSLATWLSEHPHVFFCPTKEPHFFNFDFAERACLSLEKYESLFSAASTKHSVIGEASTWYLYSRTAVPAIMEYTNNPRFIVMVRNPVDMAYSLYEQTVFNGDEDDKDFEHAWDLQAQRIYGGKVPNNCIDPQLLQYGKICKLGSQLQRIFTIATRRQVLVVNLADIKNDPATEYQRILNFLKLEDDGRIEFPVINAAKERNSPRIWNSVRRINRALRAAGVPHIRLGITAYLSEHDRQERPRQPMNSSMRERLCDYFYQDIELLEKLTEWDLSSWRSGT